MTGRRLHRLFLALHITLPRLFGRMLLLLNALLFIKVLIVVLLSMSRAHSQQSNHPQRPGLHRNLPSFSWYVAY